MSEQRKRDGFGVVTRDVVCDPSISPTAKCVYLVLAIYRDWSTSECFPSVTTISEGLGVSTRTVQRGLEELERHHVVRKEARFLHNRQTTNRFILTDAIARRAKGVTLWDK